MSEDLRKKTLILGILDIVTWLIVMGACAFMVFGAYALINIEEFESVGEALAGVFAIVILTAMFILAAIVFAIVSLFVLASGIINVRNATTKKENVIVNGYNMFIAVLSFIYFVGLLIGFFISVADLAEKHNAIEAVPMVFCIVLAGLFMAGGILKIKAFKQAKAEKANFVEKVEENDADAEYEIVSVGEVQKEEE